MKNPSPLRYPGGKISLFEVIRATIYKNRVQGCTYVEPFAGGAGAGVKLLTEGHVDRIIINDRDRAVYCFWKSIMQRTSKFVERVMNVELTIPEWEKQRDVYRSPVRRSEFDLGFAAFYLNRCNRSGIIVKAGPIGGIAQTGKWKIDARFNREGLAGRIDELAGYGDRISVSCEDASDLIRSLKIAARREQFFVYADPPYYVQGKALYLNHYADQDHASFARLITRTKQFPWVMTYDDVPRIREIYQSMNISPFRLRYSAHKTSLEGGEVFIAPPHVELPDNLNLTLQARARNAGKVLGAL